MKTEILNQKNAHVKGSSKLTGLCFVIFLSIMTSGLWAQSLSVSASIYSSCYSDSLTGRLLGYVSVMDTGGTAPYTYKWSNGAASASLSSLPNGTYTVTITDSKGVTATSSVTVNCVTPPLSDSLTFYCSNDSNGTINNYAGYAYTNVNGGFAPYTYNWSDGTSNSYDGPLTNGSYTVTLTDANGNSVISSVNVNCIIPPLSVSASVTCYQDSSSGYKGDVYASVSGGYTPYTYLWSNGDSGSYVWPLSNASYTVTVTDAKGVSATSSVTVYCVTPALADSITFYCSNDSTGGINNYAGFAYTNANGGLYPYSYNWSDGTTNSNDGPLANGTYSVTITDGNGNTVISSLSVNCVRPALSVSASSGCSQDSINGNTGPNAYKGYAYAYVYGGNFPYTYLWSDGTTNANDGPLSNGSYTVTVTDAKGNTATSSVTINCTCLPPTVSYVITPDSNMAHWYNLWTNYSPNTVSATWYWGDGSNTQGLWASHTYATGNFYQICVVTYDSCGDSAKFCMNDSIFKMNSNSTIIHANASKPTGISEKTELDVKLNMYPNPANNNVTVAYELNHSSIVTVTVYDVLGSKVLNVENQNKAEGSYQTHINTEQLNSGIYLVRLTTDGQVSSSRLIITK